jgi:hypothetical protein
VSSLSYVTDPLVYTMLSISPCTTIRPTLAFSRRSFNTPKRLMECSYTFSSIGRKNDVI